MRQDQKEDIRAIREMMEKSSKFLSISGLAVIVAGVTAIIGAAYAYFYILKDAVRGYAGVEVYNRESLIALFVTALVVLIVSLFVCFWFSWRKARRGGRKFFDKVAYRTFYNLAVPLVAGGLFCLAYLWRGDVESVMAGTLIFYGLALVNVSKFTYGEIHYLGLIEVVLGLLTLYFGNLALIFWVLGFGVCHIVYGVTIYVKYDR